MTGPLSPGPGVPGWSPQGAEVLTGWHKSTYSDPDQSCVEVGGSVERSLVGVCDTKNRTAGALVFSTARGGRSPRMPSTTASPREPGPVHGPCDVRAVRRAGRVSGRGGGGGSRG
ncbi:DUF397 domain-containing protein [Actinosynnema sp. NPDC004786]